jgi:hypothetical protein
MKNAKGLVYRGVDFSEQYVITLEGDIYNHQTKTKTKKEFTGRFNSTVISFKGKVYRINIEKAMLEMGMINRLPEATRKMTTKTFPIKIDRRKILTKEENRLVEKMILENAQKYYDKVVLPLLEVLEGEESAEKLQK